MTEAQLWCISPNVLRRCLNSVLKIVDAIMIDSPDQSVSVRPQIAEAGHEVHPLNHDFIICLTTESLHEGYAEKIRDTMISTCEELRSLCFKIFLLDEQGKTQTSEWSKNVTL